MLTCKTQNRKALLKAIENTHQKNANEALAGLQGLQDTSGVINLLPPPKQPVNGHPNPVGKNKFGNYGSKKTSYLEVSTQSKHQTHLQSHPTLNPL